MSHYLINDNYGCKINAKLRKKGDLRGLVVI